MIDEQLERRRTLLMNLNRVVAPHLRSLPNKDVNELITTFDEGIVIIGGDSLCLHMEELLGMEHEDGTIIKNDGRAQLTRSGVAEDCNPWLADEAPGLTDAMRDYLQWSWDFAIAQAMSEDTWRHNAQWINGGIVRGENATDSELIRDFIENRMPELPENFDAEPMWKPDDRGFTHAELLAAMRTHPKWDEIATSILQERQADAES